MFPVSRWVKYGIVALATALADAIHPQVRSCAAPVAEATAEQQAFSHVLAACHAAYCDQPAGRVRDQIERALKCDPAIKEFMHAILDLLRAGQR